VTDQAEWDRLFDELYLRSYVADPDADAEAADYQIRVYTAGEVVALLHSAGFATVELFGGLEGEPLAIASRLVAVAER
jgi:hypothetical protein